MRREKSCGALVLCREDGEWKMLLTQNRNGGHWAFLKGHVEAGETEKETAIREVLEETGLEVSQATYLFSIPNTYLFSGFLVHTLDQFFLCKVKEDSSLRAMDDVAESFWLPLSEVNPEEFGLNSVRQGVIRFLQTFEG